MTAHATGQSSPSYRHPSIPVRAAIAAGALVLCLAGRVEAQAGPSAAPVAATPAAADSTKPLTPDQLDALVAPVALYPDDLLAQTLAAATYPLEIIQLQQWMAKHPGLKDKALADSVSKQPWDPSVQSMAALPDVVKRLADDIQWTTELGNAFLGQQKEVMAAVQRMRAKAKDKGALTTDEHQKVETQTVDKQQVIVIESQNPEVIYVPQYVPTAVYGPPVYPYPPIYYPPYPPGGMFLSFTVGMMWGAAIWGGACCHMGWHGGGTVVINNHNHFNNINTGGGGRGGNWEHRPEHRGGTPYGDRGTANKYGGSTRPSTSDRAAGAGGRGAGVSDRAAGAGQGQRGAGVSDRAAGAGQGQRGAGVSDRSTGGIGERAPGTAGAGVSDRAGAGGQGQRPSTSDRGGGGLGGSSGLSGGSRGFDGASARSSSSRGASSFGGGGGRGGGGMRGGGGGRRR